MAKHPKNEIVGQYASDYFLHPNHPGLEDDSLGVKTRGKGSVAFHHSQTLFDESDGTINEIDGRVRRVTGEDDLKAVEGMSIVPDRMILGSLSRVRRGEPPIDPADEWMKKNGHKW